MPKIIESFVPGARAHWETEFLYLRLNHATAKCVICGKLNQTRRVYNMGRHFNSCHREKHGMKTVSEREELLNNYRDSIARRSPSAGASAAAESEESDHQKALAASYAIALEIARSKRCWADGSFIKNCLIEMAKSFKNETAVKQFESVPLSRNTVSRRIEEMDNNVQNQLGLLIENSIYFSLCLHESTDTKDSTQLLIFIRTAQMDFSVHEDLLSLVSLPKGATGKDIFHVVKTEIEKFTDFENCSSIVTDGTPAILGSDNDFVKMLKTNGINCPMLHCIVHQEVLCAKSLNCLSVLKVATKVINHIREWNQPITHRRLKAFLNHVNTTYADVAVNSPIRWLNAGACLKRFFAIRREIAEFLGTDNAMLQVQEEIKTCKFTRTLAFLTDLMAHLSEFNLKLKEKGQNIASSFEHIFEFRKFLDLLAAHLEQEELTHFPCCQEIKTEFPNITFSCFKENITDLGKEFSTRFCDIDTLKQDIFLYTNAQSADIKDQRPELQEELSYLQVDPNFSVNQITGEDLFMVLPNDLYPKLRDFGLRMFSMFTSTYTSEASFSAMKIMKLHSRRAMTDISLLHALRLATTDLVVDINALSKDATKFNSSH